MRLDSKTILTKAYFAEKHLKQVRDRLAESRNRLTSTTKEVSDMPGSPNRNIDGMQKLIASVIDEENLYINQLATIESYRIEAIKLIQKVDDPVNQMILEMRHLDYMKFEDIAAELGYDMRHVQRRHDYALSELDKTCHKMS